MWDGFIRPGGLFIMTVQHFEKEAITAEMAKRVNEERYQIETAMRMAYPSDTYSWEINQPVKIPGAYNVWASGINGDVTILAWLHSDGSVTVKNVAW